MSEIIGSGYYTFPAKAIPVAMTLLEKLERTLALARELGMNDKQVEELMSVVLGLPITRITYQQPQTLPFIPWGVGTIPNTDTPPFPGTTIICNNP